MPEITARLQAALADRYAIQQELGAGGMATVYLAEDLKHHRKVAVKVLRPELAAVLGAERFLREIEVTANLQHPHILPLFDSGEADSFLYYVMPHVEGESLRDRLNRDKQLPVDEAVRIAEMVASALDYAHRHDIVHRDIKPENILLHDEQALVADFGIALAVSAAAGARMTETGLSLGTPHYMSPEQATADRDITGRSDVYSLACVTYEMLAGDPPYLGNTAQAIIAKIISDVPRPVRELRATVPGHVELALHKALEKLPADRFATAKQFADALTNPSFGSDLYATELRRASASHWKRLSIATTAVAAGSLVIAAWALLRPEEPGRVTRFAVKLDANQALYYGALPNYKRLSIAPNGSEIVYSGGSNPPTLWFRSFDQLDGRPLPGTDRGWAPAISPDGDRVAFRVGGLQRSFSGEPQLLIASLAGGPVTTIVDSGVGSSHSWGPDDHLYYVDATGFVIRRVAATGGMPEEVVALGRTPTGSGYGSLHVLPRGRGAFVTEYPSDRSQLADYKVHIIDLESGESRASVAGVYAVYARSGHVVYVIADGTMMAAGFDERSLALEGRSVALFDGVDVRPGGFTDITLSANGVLAYANNTGFGTPEVLVWASRDGRVRPVDPGWSGELELEGLALSPDATRLALEVVSVTRTDIWVKQLDEGPVTLFTFDGEQNSRPTWTPDGRWVTFARAVDGEFSIWRRPADGGSVAEFLTTVAGRVEQIQWSADGSALVIGAVTGMGSDVLVFRPGVDSVPSPILAEAFNEAMPALSPDDRWLAYVSDESGRSEVYIRPFPDVAGSRWRISNDGGHAPVWSADSRTLFYRSADVFRGMMKADLTRGPSVAQGRVMWNLPEENDYEFNNWNRLYDVSPDGRFIFIERAGGVSDVSGDLVIVQNFFEELKAKVGR